MLSHGEPQPSNWCYHFVAVWLAPAVLFSAAHSRQRSVNIRLSHVLIGSEHFRLPRLEERQVCDLNRSDRSTLATPTSYAAEYNHQPGLRGAVRSAVCLRSLAWVIRKACRLSLPLPCMTGRISLARFTDGPMLRTNAQLQPSCLKNLTADSRTRVAREHIRHTELFQ